MSSNRTGFNWARHFVEKMLQIVYEQSNYRNELVHEHGEDGLLKKERNIKKPKMRIHMDMVSGGLL